MKTIDFFGLEFSEPKIPGNKATCDTYMLIRGDHASYKGWEDLTEIVQK